MQISLLTQYRSITPFEIELPDFVILTGLNGSGKTQFLESISNSIARVKEGGNAVPKQSIRYIPSHSFSPNQTGAERMSSDLLRKQRTDIWNLLLSYQNALSSDPRAHLKNFVNDNRINIINKVCDEAGKTPAEISSSEFYTYYPVDDRAEDKDVFGQNFSSTFKSYCDKKNENRYNIYRRDTLREQVLEPIFTDEQFLEKFGPPPWEIINEILTEAGLDYVVNSPEEGHREAPFEVKFVNKTSQASVSTSDLSSGEKVLMSLALALYNLKDNVHFPKLLLLDEPDASLHPAMSQVFLNILQSVFVKSKKVIVYLTTHSPSTIALAPESAIYTMYKEGKIRIEKTSKDNALKVLTSGVPSLSIDYENRRQVFVESKNDVVAYERIYEKIKDRFVNERSLCFISSGVGGSGSCNQVIEVVDKLVNNGSKTVYGIVDWDQNNVSRGHVRVLGEGVRYSIENYVYDPLLLTALLVREGEITGAMVDVQELGSYMDLKKLTPQELQSVCLKIIDRIPKTTADQTKKRVQYLGGLELEIPIWFLEYQGHNLEDQIKNVYSGLQRFHREASLRYEILTKVINEFPEFIPKDIYSIFAYIQEQ